MANVGELFVSLGIKGADKTIEGVTGVKNALKETASVSLETKAAIIGAAYALERLFEASGQRGTALKNFSAELGMSTKTLQQYQYAAQQVGISNDEMAGTFENIQKNMTKTLLGKGAPEGLAMFAHKTGNVTADDIKQYQAHPEEFIQKLMEYVKTEKNEGLRNMVLESFGVSPNFARGLLEGAFTPDKLAKAPVYSDKEINQLDKANVGWKNLATSIEMFFGHLNAKHGGELVQGITDLIKPLEKVVESLVNFAEKIKLFDGLKIMFQDMAKAINWMADSFDRMDKSKALKEVLAAPVENTLEKVSQTVLPDNTNKPIGNSTADGIRQFFLDMLKAVVDQRAGGLDVGMSQYGTTGGFENPGKVGNSKDPLVEKAGRYLFPKKTDNPGSPFAAPTAPITKTHASNQNINVHQSLTFQNDGSNAQSVGDAVKKTMQNAFRQIPAQSQGA